jgi:hypothetical protein
MRNSGIRFPLLAIYSYL